MAALLHDHLQHHLITPDRPRRGDPERVTPDEADAIFRQALLHSRVPFLRRWVMWAAVALRTVFLVSVAGRVAVVAWCLLFALLGVAWPLVAVVAAATPELGWRYALGTAGAAFGLPVLTCWWWRSRWRLGLVSGLTLALVALPSLLAVLAVGVYFGLEALVRALLRERTHLVAGARDRPEGQHT